MSTTDHIQQACTACQKLISQQLDAREDLARAQARAPGSAEVVVLQDKVRKLQAATQTQFMKVMRALGTSR